MQATEALSKDNINLIEGEIIIRSLVQQTATFSSPLAKEFHDSLVEKLSVRRNTLMTSLALYLSNSDFLTKAEINKYPLKLESKKTVQIYGTELLKRLYKGETQEDLAARTPLDDEKPLTFQELLRKNIDDQRQNMKNEHVSQDLNAISKHFKMYDLTKERSPILEKFFFAVCSIQPTSVQSERNFSLASCFVSKIRSSLSPKHVDMLCFLKSQFISEIKTSQ